MQDKYFSSQEFKDLLRKYEAATAKGGSVYMEPDELTDIAEYYYAAGQHQKALDTVDYALSIFPDATPPLVFMARHALISGNNTRLARQYAEKITDTSDLDYIYLCAEILLNEDKVEEAEDYLQRAYESLDDDEDCADFVLDVATIYADYDMPDRARQWLNLSNEPHLADYKELEGRIAISRGEYKKSEDIFNQLLDEDPYSTPYWNHLASSQFRRNRISDSIASSEFSIAINPNDEEAILNKANGLYALSNYEEALHYYQRFTQLCPDEDMGYLLQGITLLNMNRVEEAVSLLQEAEKRAQPDSANLPEIYQEIAFTLSRLDRVDQALAYLDKAAMLDRADQNLLHVLRGHIMLEHGYIEEAYRHFQTAVNRSGSSRHVFFHIAISVYDCGYLSLARKMFETLVEGQSDEADAAAPAADRSATDGSGRHPDGYAYLAACHRELGNRKQYLRYLKTACEVNPEETRAVFFDDFPPELSPEEYYDYEMNNK